MPGGNKCTYTAGMPIIPDTKDWTWVPSRPCPECGFDASAVTPAAAPGMITSMLPRWRAALRRPDAAERPDEATWSVLEYGCHVRDVFTLFDHRLSLMLTEDDARFYDWDQDKTAIEKDYANADPAEVGAELTAEGEQIAASFARVPEQDWAQGDPEQRLGVHCPDLRAVLPARRRPSPPRCGRLARRGIATGTASAKRLALKRAVPSTRAVPKAAPYGAAGWSSLSHAMLRLTAA